MAACSYSTFTNMMRRQLARKILDYSYRYFQDDFAGRIAGKVIDTPSAMRRFTFLILDDVVYFISLVFGMALTLLTIDHKYLLFVLIYLAVFVLILLTFIPHIQLRTRHAAKTMNITRGRYIDVIVNVLLVKVFSRRRYEDQVMLENIQNNAQGWLRRDYIDWVMGSLVYLSLIVLFAVTLFFLWNDITHHAMSAGDVSLVLGCLIFISNNGVWIFTDVFGIVPKLRRNLRRHRPDHRRARSAGSSRARPTLSRHAR
jgi:ATP-binding cassette subfamily B multidrug efflux pump